MDVHVTTSTYSNYYVSCGRRRHYNTYSYYYVSYGRTRHYGGLNTSHTGRHNRYPLQNLKQ